MSTVDIIVLIAVILIISSIIFFSFIFPRISSKKTGQCASCPVVKKAKRLPKDYKREQSHKKGEK